MNSYTYYSFFLFFLNDLQFTLLIFTISTFKNFHVVSRTSKAQAYYWPAVDAANQAGG